MRRVWMLALLLGMSGQMMAQDDDFGVWLDANAEKKLSKKWSVAAGLEFRTRDNSKTVDRWSGNIGTEYKIADFLSASAGYELLYDHHAAAYTYHKDGTVNKIIPTYWGVRHRFNVSLTGNVDWRRFNFSLRERWQYTYRPESENRKYDTDTEEWSAVKGKGSNLLRSRLQIKYKFPKSPFSPFANVELFHGSGGLQKTRYTLGTEYDINKHHEIKAYYRYQNTNSDDDDNESNLHILGVSYTFKF